MKFGLACEGVTDYITLKNILCGYFPDINPRTQIRQLQPELDATDETQLDFGGWEKLLTYLQSVYFQDALEDMDFMIIQLDSDISEHKNFGVSHYDKDNQELSSEQLIVNIKNRLVETINKNELDFYGQYADKIIFAVCVHSLECWIYAYHNSKSLKKPKITGCGKALEYLLNKKGFDNKKDKELYKKYSHDFSIRKNIDSVISKSPSFNSFIQQLQTIELPNNE
jgi:hypothetical protein